MKHYKNFPIVAIFFITGVFMSCDKEYDISKNINTDIKVGEYFSVPVGKTDTIKLSRIIKESNSVKPGDNYIYEIVTSGSTSSTIDLTNVSVNITPYIGSTNIDLSSISNMINTRTIKSQAITIPSITVQSDPYSVNTKLPKEVDELSRANLSKADTYLTLYIEDGDWDSSLDDVTLSNFNVTFPKILETQQGSNTFKYDGNITLSTAAKTQTITIPFTAIDIPDELQSSYITGTTGDKSLQLSEILTITADISVSVNNIPTKTQIPVHFSYSTDGEVSIKDVSGVFHTSANINEVIEINDLPEFLNEGKSTFTPNEVNFTLNLENPINIPWNLSLDFQSFKGTSQASDIVNVPISASPGTNTMLISNKTGADVYVVELPALFAFVPDKFSIASSEDISLASKDRSQTIELGTTITINAKYDVAIPFSFSNLHIEYTDSIDDLAKDLYDVFDAVDTNEIYITATAESSIPAELAASVELYDVSGTSLDSGITVDLQECVIQGAEVDDNSAVKSSPIVIKLTQTQSGYFKRLDRIKFTINASSISNSMSLRSNQFIFLKDINVKIPNGLTLTL